MVVDEELKMMCDICTEGGQVLGPFLKPMSRLIHTEYLLAGRTSRDPREVLRDTMYAATVTGSPVENACRLIKQYETEGRGYYGAALAILGRDAGRRAGRRQPDRDPYGGRRPRRTAHGHGRRDAGARLRPGVRGRRDPRQGGRHPERLRPRTSRTRAERRTSPSWSTTRTCCSRSTPATSDCPRFWLTDQAGTPPDPRLRGKHVVVVDGEDDFVNMLRHVLGVLGLTSSVIRHDEYDAATHDPVLDAADLVIVGPGPGDPRDEDDPKMAVMRGVVDRLLEREQPFLAVCLGHQALCHRLGLDLAFKDIVFQGTQSPVSIEGRTERVGFYNTFVARTGGRDLPAGVEVEADPESGDIHLVRGPHFRGIQFHAESILTQHGYDLIHDLVRDLVR